MRKSIVLSFLLLAACHREQPLPVQHGAAKPAAKPSSGSGYGTSGAGVPKGPTTETTAAGDEGTEVGKVMPAYTATWLDGKPFDLGAERGNVVFLNLWATWCGPCRFELPALQEMQQKYSSQNFKVIGVSLDESGAAAVKEFVTSEKITYPIALDPEGKLANLLQTTVVPTSVLIDRSGKIVWKESGAITANDPELTAALEKALK